MNYSPTSFAKAFLAALAETPKEKHAALLKNFLKVVERYRAGLKIKNIVADIEALSLKQSGGRKIVLEMARPLNDKVRREILAQFGKKDRVEVKIKPEIIAGIKIIIDDEAALDNTLKRKLGKLFPH